MEADLEVALYVRLISGMILGLAVARLLTGIGKLVSHPQRYKADILHILWVSIAMMAILIYWWEEALSFSQVDWTYPLYLLQIIVCCIYYLLAITVLPEEIDGYDSYRDYFMARRRWLYGLMIFANFASEANAAVKTGHLGYLTEDVWVDMLVVAVFLYGCWSSSPRTQVTIASLATFLAGAAFVGYLFV